MRKHSARSEVLDSIHRNTSTNHRTTQFRQARLQPGWPAAKTCGTLARFRSPPGLLCPIEAITNKKHVAFHAVLSVARTNSDVLSIAAVSILAAQPLHGRLIISGRDACLVTCTKN